MALSIGVSEGSKIKIGHKLLSVEQIQDSRHISIRYGNHRHLITDAERTEIDKDVYVFCGIAPARDPNPNSSRLAFEAPRAIKIHRVKETLNA